MIDWLPASQAPDGVVVDTKVHDEIGARNHVAMVRHGEKWFFPTSELPVHYVPTHYRPLQTHRQAA
jgi:hypothetical protein